MNLFLLKFILPTVFSCFATCCQTDAVRDALLRAVRHGSVITTRLLLAEIKATWVPSEVAHPCPEGVSSIHYKLYIIGAIIYSAIIIVFAMIKTLVILRSN